jgi:hypothetical protein
MDASIVSAHQGIDVELVVLVAAIVLISEDRNTRQDNIDKLNV